MAGAGRRGRSAGRVVSLLPGLHLQRHGLAAGDELPQSPALSPAAQAQDARGNDGNLVVDGRHPDRRPDFAGGGLAVTRSGLERHSRFDARHRATSAPRSTRCSRIAACRGRGRRARDRPRRRGRSRRRHRARKRVPARPTIPTLRSRPPARDVLAARTPPAIPRAAPRAASRPHRRGVRRASRGHRKRIRVIGKSKQEPGWPGRKTGRAQQGRRPKLEPERQERGRSG